MEVYTVDSISTIYTLGDVSHTVMDEVTLEEQEDKLSVLIAGQYCLKSTVFICKKIGRLSEHRLWHASQYRELASSVGGYHDVDGRDGFRQRWPFNVARLILGSRTRSQ